MNSVDAMKGDKFLGVIVDHRSGFRTEPIPGLR